MHVSNGQSRAGKISLFQVLVNWRMAVVLLTGFSSGLPYALTGTTLQMWMTHEGVKLGTIGLLTAVTFPYTLKFLWSPLLDRFVPPFLGRRRGWMIVSQHALLLGIAAMGIIGVSNPAVIAAIAMLVAFFSATQDIAVDAYRTELLNKEELGAGAALYIMGYRVGILCSGASSLILADYMSWRVVYLVMAAMMAVGIVTSLLAPEPKMTARPPATLIDAVVRPFAEFLRRRGAIEMLLFILIYKLDWSLVQAMMMPFMAKIGFSQSQIGAVTQGLGVFATIGGAMIGGTAMARLGIYRSLWLFGLLQGLAGISFTLLAIVGKNLAMMTAAIVVENTCTGMATAAFTGFIMSLCNKQFTATQFALLSSLMALGRVIAGMPSGKLQEWVGWPCYFIIATVIAVPGLLLLLRYKTWQTVASDKVPLESRQQEPAAASR